MNTPPSQEKNLDTLLLKERLSRVSHSETFSEDIKQIASMENNSAVSAMIREEEEKALQRKELWLGSTKNIVLFICIFFFSITSFVSLYFLWKPLSASKIAQTSTIDPVDSFFISEDTVSLKKEISSDLLSEIKDIHAQSVPSHTVKKILFQKEKECSFEEIEQLSKTSIPLGIKSSFYGKCMYGLYGLDQNPSFFLLTELRNLTELASIDAWEADISKAITPLFGTERFTKDKTDLFNKKFESLVFENKDMRVLRTNSGDPVLYYGFILNKYLVISENKESILHIENRLRK